MVTISSTGSVPSDAWIEIGRISGLTASNCMIVAANGPITGFGAIGISGGGIISVYHALGTNSSFFNNSLITFITS
jgi:hypothetical protein